MNLPDFRRAWDRFDEEGGAAVSFAVIFLSLAYFAAHVLFMHVRKHFGI